MKVRVLSDRLRLVFRDRGVSMPANNDGWARVHGTELGGRLNQLEALVGRAGVLKFLDGKLHGLPYGGLYISGVLHQADGIAVVSDLVDRALRGEVIRLVSIAAYYAHGCRIPEGMQIVAGKLVDIVDARATGPRDQHSTDNHDRQSNQRSPE